MWNPAIVITFKFKLLTAIGALTLLSPALGSWIFERCLHQRTRMAMGNVGFFTSEEEIPLLTGAFSPPAAYDVSVYFEWKC